MSGISLWQLLILLGPIVLIGVIVAVASKRKPSGREPQPIQQSGVRVVDIEMPFGSMVTFMVKWALASIPAFLILALFGTAVAMVLGAA